MKDEQQTLCITAAWAWQERARGESLCCICSTGREKWYEKTSQVYFKGCFVSALAELFSAWSVTLWHPMDELHTLWRHTKWVHCLAVGGLNGACKSAKNWGLWQTKSQLKEYKIMASLLQRYMVLSELDCSKARLFPHNFSPFFCCSCNKGVRGKRIYLCCDLGKSHKLSRAVPGEYLVGRPRLNGVV